jgi:two-component system, LuxR family, sensor kinase FixL
MFYLLFVPVVIAAVRHGLDGACFSLAVTQFGLIAFLRFSGYDAAEFAEFQAQMLVLTVTGLIVGVVVSERENA